MTGSDDSQAVLFGNVAKPVAVFVNFPLASTSVSWMVLCPCTPRSRGSRW